MKKNTFLKDGIPTLKPTSIEDICDFVLVDVRRPDEFNGELGHIEGATLKTLGPELENFLNSANKSDTILFICRSGVRSAHATALAMDLGFANVFNMEGGMIYWNEKVK